MTPEALEQKIQDLETEVAALKNILRQRDAAHAHIFEHIENALEFLGADVGKLAAALVILKSTERS